MRRPQPNITCRRRRRRVAALPQVYNRDYIRAHDLCQPSNSWRWELPTCKMMPWQTAFTVVKKEVSDSANKHFLRRRTFYMGMHSSARIRTGSFYRYDMVFCDFYRITIYPMVSDDRAIEISGEENIMYTYIVTWFKFYYYIGLSGKFVSTNLYNLINVY